MAARASWLSTATVLFYAWSLLSIGVRFWVTLGRRHKWSFSDSALLAATIVAALHVGSNFWAVGNDYGLPASQINSHGSSEVYKALFMGQITYIATVGFTKLSTALFIGQLTRHRPQVVASRMLSASTTAWTVVCCVLIALRAPLSAPWMTIDGTSSMQHRWIAIEVTGLLLELVLWLLSISLIWGLQMKLSKRLTILFAFGSRLLLIPIVSLRLYYLSPSENYDPTTSNIASHILTEAVMAFALISTSITSLKPFLKPFHTGAIVNTVGGTGSGLYSGSNSRNAGLYVLASSRRHEDKGNSRIITTVQSYNDGNDAEHVSAQATASHKGKRCQNMTTIESGSGHHRSSDTSTHTNSSEQMIIRTTKAWEVRYEDA